MKYSEMNQKQQKAYRNIYHAACWIIGGIENTMLDNPEDSDEYKSAEAQLNNHEALVEGIYNEAITALYTEDGCEFGPHAERYLRDVRFCGKDFLMERVDRRVRKLGY